MKRFFLFLALLISHAAFCQDLIVKSVTGELKFQQYEEFRNKIVVQNQGIVAASYFSTTIYLSTDAVLDKGLDVYLGGFTFDKIDAGELKEGTIGMYSQIRVVPGTYYLIINGDDNNRIKETDEGNNLLAIPNVIVSKSNIDLTLLDFKIDKGAYTYGEEINADFTIANIGKIQSGGSVATSFFISQDKTISLDDVELDYNVVRLNGPDTIKVSFKNLFAIKVPAGNYFLLASIDNRKDFEETNEGNNIFSIPFTITPSNIDLEILDDYYDIKYNDSSNDLHLDVNITNKGTSEVTHFAVSGTVTDVTGSPVSFPSAFWISERIGPGETKRVYLYYYGVFLFPGTYKLVLEVNPEKEIIETDYTNNQYLTKQSFYVAPPPVESIALNSISFPSDYLNTTTNLSLQVEIANTGTAVYYSVYYDLNINDGTGKNVMTIPVSFYMDVARNQTMVKSIPIDLQKTLPVGKYTAELKCKYSFCNTTPTSRTCTLNIIAARYNINGIVKGEDGSVIDKGKIFLYTKKPDGIVSFIQTDELNGKSDFSYKLDSKEYTFYFIPDEIKYPQFVPTIFGKTLQLQPGSFINPTADASIMVEVIKMVPLTKGTGIIKGSVAKEGSGTSAGRIALSTTGVANQYVALMSATGVVHQLQKTNVQGEFEFNNLPRNDYTLLLIGRPDSIVMESPISVDISAKNVILTFQLGAGEVSVDEGQLILPQTIQFEKLPTVVYGQQPITMLALSDADLPVTFLSSNQELAEIDGDKVIIKRPGSVSIFAKQEGNSFYGPASNSQQLLIEKAEQSITSNTLPRLVFGTRSIKPNWSSTSNLPVAYKSSDERIALVQGDSIKILGAGIVTITGIQDGNELYKTTSVVESLLTIDKANQFITVGDIGAKTFGDASFKLEIQSGSKSQVIATSSDEAVAKIKGDLVEIVGAGKAIIRFTQNGNDNFYPAPQIEKVLNVTKAKQIITSSQPPDMFFGDAPRTLDWKSSSGLPLIIRSSDQKIAVIEGNKIVIKGTGTVIISASQGGNNNYEEALTISSRLTINKASQEINFIQPEDKNVSEGSFELKAFASSSLDVSFFTDQTDVISIKGNIATILKEGIVTVTARQSGNGNYEEAPSISRTFVILAPLGVENNMRLLEVYPNPTNDFITLDHHLNLLEIIVYDTKGRIVKKDKPNTRRLDLSDLLPGTYYLSVVEATRSTLLKVIRK